MIETHLKNTNKELAKQNVRNFNSVVEDKIGKKDLALFFKIITELAEQQYKTLKQS